MRVDASKEEVLKLYEQGGPETDESTQLYFVLADTFRQAGS